MKFVISLLLFVASLVLYGCGGQTIVTRVNAIDGKVMVRVPAGSFKMGTSETQVADLKARLHVQAALFAGEPDQSIDLAEFYIDQTPVTNADYKKFIDAHSQEPVPALDNALARSFSWDPATRTFPAGRGQYPAVLINWAQAGAYCAWAGGRLPSEAEWEKAARGADGRIWPWGDEFDARKLNSAESNKMDATPVGAYPEGASPYGALDMAGNVWQWTSSLDRPLPYNASDGREDATASGFRVTRGGAWLFGAAVTRAAMRNRFDPAGAAVSIGFRCVQ